MSIRDRIGTVAERIKQRMGRSFGTCHNCGKPTRSHEVGTGKACHECHSEGGLIPMTDGGGEPIIESFPENVPRQFRETERWVCWANLEVSDGKYNKVPVAPWADGNAYPSKDYKEKITDFDRASRFANLDAYSSVLLGEYGVPDDMVAKLGLFYHLPPADEGTDFLFIDLDDVRDADTGALHPTAIDLIDRADSYAQVSTSGTGVHIFLNGSLPDEYAAIDASLDGTEQFPEAAIEVYDNDRLIAMTGDHIEGTPETVNENAALMDSIVSEYASRGDKSGVDGRSKDEYTEPATSRNEIREVDKTQYIQDVFDALYHVDPMSIRLKSTVTQERSNGFSMDPAFGENSESGTRLWLDDDGFVYRKGKIHLTPLQVVALEEGIVSTIGENPSGEDFWDAVDALRDRGAHVPELDRTSRFFSSAAILPDVPRGTGKQGITTDELRERVFQTLKTAMIEERDMTVDAIMSGGKTYGTFKAAADLDHQVTYFAPRLDMYDQAAEYAKEVGIPEDEIKILPSLKRDCPTWDGHHGSEWEERVKRQYYAGARPKVIHDQNDGIPCREEHDGECPYEAMWDFDPDDYQVIIGHYKHSHVTHVTMGRTAVFDEDPASAFTTRLEGGQLQQSINTFLDMDVSPPVEDFDELLRIRRDDRRVKECMRWYNQMRQAGEFDFGSPDSANVVALDGENYHGYAPHAVYAILNSEPIEEGSNFERGFIPEGLSGSLFFTTSDEYGDYYVEFRESPKLHYTNATVALDGTPLIDESRSDPHKVREWSMSLGTDLEHHRILSDEERRNYIRDTLGHTYVQVSNGANPYSSGRYNNMTEDAALCAGVREFYGGGDAPVVFTPKAVADQYEEAGFERDGLAKTIDYPGNLRGTDRYGEERLAVQLGSSHHGDHEIRRRAAWLRETVEVSGKGMDRDYGSPLANSILKQMRENQTAQNVMRVGRDGGGALIVLKTAAIPDYFPVAGKGGVTPWPDGMKEVLTAWTDLSPSELKTVEVAEIAAHDAVSVSERQVRNALDSFCELGYVKKGDHPNDGRKNVYVDDGLGGVDPEEYAEVELPELDWDSPAGGDEGDGPEVRLTNIYTSDFDSSDAELTEQAQSHLPMGVGDATGDMDRGDPPTEE